MTDRMLEPSWWTDPDAAPQRRALIGAFQVEQLEAATDDLWKQARALEGADAEVSDLADLLLAYWSVGFHIRVAQAQRAFFSTDHDRLRRAVAHARAVIADVGDRVLNPRCMSPRALQAALDLANAQAPQHRPSRADALSLPPPRLSEAARNALQAWKIVGECQHRWAATGDAFSAAVGLLVSARVTELINALPAGDRAAVRAHIVTDEQTGTASLDGQQATR